MYKRKDTGFIKSGMQPGCSVGTKYLSYLDDDLNQGIKAGDEASDRDKVHFFQLMETFMIPPEYFEPLPEESPKPQKRDYPSGTLDNYTRITFKCTEDQDLLVDREKAIGKTYTLIDQNGLKAEIEVIEILEDNKKDNDADSSLRAFGTIEGYTSSRKREIEVALFDNTAEIHLITLISRDDKEALDMHPLWEGYREHLRKKNLIYESVIEKVKNRYISD